MRMKECAKDGAPGPDDAGNFGGIARMLLGWYRVHQRDLPWRRTRDPYRIWLSEIMLQQTRVAAVLEHYARFTELFPTVQALAAASEPEVLAVWSGLGYYRRARMMHRAAQQIVAEYDGELPRTAADLLLLPGIGGYTSAAIASIAFGESVAVVDGNVERVLARIVGWSAAEPGFAGAVRRLAATLAPLHHAGDYNQAMMELGATVCLPRAPLCLQCPLQARCRTRGEHTPAPRKQTTAREIAFALCTREGENGTEVLLEQRALALSLMPGMWELPEIAPPDGEKPVLTLRHAITVTNYTVRILRSTPERLSARCQERGWFPRGELHSTALTGLARKVLRRIGLYARADVSEPQRSGGEAVFSTAQSRVTRRLRSK